MYWYIKWAICFQDYTSTGVYLASFFGIEITASNNNIEKYRYDLINLSAMSIWRMLSEFKYRGKIGISVTRQRLGASFIAYPISHQYVLPPIQFHLKRAEYFIKECAVCERGHTWHFSKALRMHFSGVSGHVVYNDQIRHERNAMMRLIKHFRRICAAYLLAYLCWRYAEGDGRPMRMRRGHEILHDVDAIYYYAFWLRSSFYLFNILMK